MKYKLVVLDIDGTLLTSRHTITRKTIRIINTARQKGLQITLATGRNFLNARRIAQKLKINLPIISNDGAYIVHPFNKAVVYEKRIPGEHVAGLMDILNKYGLHYILHHDMVNVSNRKINWRALMGYTRITSIFRRLYETGNFKIIPGNQIMEYIWNNNMIPFKVTVWADHGPDGHLDQIIPELAEQLDGVIDISWSGYKGFEILPEGISKAKGLKILENELGFDPSEIIAIGDSFNDLGMIKYAGLGIAMGNAPKEIQNSAGFVTMSNDDNGVAYALEKFYLNEY
jgi:Cof subfamily protein (haloacid dehalogenase superfamily)